MYMYNIAECYTCIHIALIGECHMCYSSSDRELSVSVESTRGPRWVSRVEHRGMAGGAVAMRWAGLVGGVCYWLPSGGRAWL